MVDMCIMPQAAVKHGIELKAISKKDKGTEEKDAGPSVCSAIVISDLAFFLYSARVVVCR